MPRAARAKALLAACAVVAPAAIPSAHAATASDTMTVTATVVQSCQVVANDLSFGAYNPIATTDLDATTTLDVTCTSGTGYIVSMDAGVGSGATIATRKMTSSGNTLNYSLYRNAARTQVWGQTSGTDTVSGTGTGAVQSLTVYGRAPAAQAAPPGSYSDTVTVTVTY
ncbi:MAG: spore coat U domain-containing protein [Hyphomonadaceae bacterium]|nr:spore coat U domain-containing protein [Hyphomonadaceae bacterium]